MKTHVIAKTHESALKGKNRPMFMRRFADNLRRATEGTGVEQVRLEHMMVCVTMSEGADWNVIRERVGQTFGVAKFFPAYKTPLDLEEVKTLIASQITGFSFDTFRITAHRSDKRFPITSAQINRELGTFVQHLTNAGVRLKNPDLEIFIDVMSKEILVYFEEIKGHGGLPVGVSGKAMALLSGGIDSPVAAWQMMKRGATVEFVHFHSHPLVDTSSMEKAAELVELLTRHQYRSTLHLVPFGRIQQQIIVSVPPSYRVVMYRRFMMRIAETLARQRKAIALVTGESLAQVASQTLENMVVIDSAVNMPVLRPVVGFNKDEIIDLARRIDTFPISIQPDQDCCSLFVPRHPVTRANAGIVRKLEESLPMDEMVSKAISEIKTKRFRFPE